MSLFSNLQLTMLVVQVHPSTQVVCVDQLDGIRKGNRFYFSKNKTITRSENLKHMVSGRQVKGFVSSSRKLFLIVFDN